MQHWLVKSEPETYSIDDFARERIMSWTGVRNFTARKNIRAMRKGDRVFFYHSGKDPEIVGEGRVASLPYPEETVWTTIDLKFIRRLSRAVSRDELLTQPAFKNSILARQGRLSVQPLTAAEVAAIERLGATRSPGKSRS